jgi:hypothetical protein
MNKILTTIKENKGAIATIIGILFALPINIFFMVQFFRDKAMSVEQLKSICVMNGIAVVWFILPSVIEIKSKLFEITIKD